MDQYKLVVFTNPKGGREDEYNDWYDNIHLDDVLRVPGFYRAQRFETARTLPGAEPTHKYLAIYEFESDDLDATFELFFKATNTPAMMISDALGEDAKPFVYKVRAPAKEHA